MRTKSNACTYGVVESTKEIKLLDGGGVMMCCVGAGIAGSGIDDIGRAPTPAGAPGIGGIAGAPAPGRSLGNPRCGPTPGGRLGIGGKLGGGEDDTGGVCANTLAPSNALQRATAKSVFNVCLGYQIAVTADKIDNRLWSLELGIWSFRSEAAVVLGAGLEPACLSAYAPQTYVSAIPPPERVAA
jgi:hypothetical protein